MNSNIYLCCYIKFHSDITKLTLEVVGAPTNLLCTHAFLGKLMDLW